MKYNTATPIIAALVKPIVAIIDISIALSFSGAFYPFTACTASGLIFIRPGLQLAAAFFACYHYREEVVFCAACGFIPEF